MVHQEVRDRLREEAYTDSYFLTNGIAIFLQEIQAGCELDHNYCGNTTHECAHGVDLFLLFSLHQNC